ncbi:MAG TPA: hypothetical protein PKY40_14350 [Burkholderiaceae bacterium]|nr:hypothetical protein [Burkholderiaceae bacterium]
MALMRRVIVPVLANVIAVPVGLAVALWPLVSELMKFAVCALMMYAFVVVMFALGGG